MRIEDLDPVAFNRLLKLTKATYNATNLLSDDMTVPWEDLEASVKRQNMNGGYALILALSMMAPAESVGLMAAIRPDLLAGRA